MFRASLVFLIIAIIATIQIFGNAGVLIVPGLRLDLDKYSITTAGVLLWLVLLPLSYNILERKNRMIPNKWIIIHLIGTLFYFIWLNYVLPVYYYINFNISIVVFSIFLLSQIIYVYLFIKYLVRRNTL
jgi:hypothetical protein